MTDTREVCTICYNSSSHKPTPILTPFSRTSYDVNTRKHMCPVCRQEWVPIRIVREQNQRWIKIRPRPKISANIDFQMCKSVNSKVECQKGPDCTFAHSHAELASWNRERQNEPRPAPQIPGPYQFQLCKHMLNTGNCPYGQRCTFAHSDEELEGWLKDQAGVPIPNGNYLQPGMHNVVYTPAPGMVPGTGMGPAGMVTEYRCDVCNLNCTSKRQLDDHLSGSKHKQMLASKALHAYNNPTPAEHGMVRGGGGGGGAIVARVRRRPTLSFPINGYKMCMHVQSGRRCVYGDFCTFAHSQEEYDVWNSQLAAANAPRATHILRFQNAGHNVGMADGMHVGRAVGGANPMGGGYDLDEFGDENVIQESRDFAEAVRSKIASEHKQTSSVSGFEKTREGVSITEISGRELSLVWSTSSAIEWLFEVAVEVPCALSSIVLFDTLSLDFEIAEVVLVNYGGQMRSLSSFATPKEGVAWQLNQQLTPPEKLHVKVKLIPRSGLLGQLVVFDFDSFVMVRGLSVHVLTEQELRLSEISETREKTKPPKPDLYWEQHFTTIPSETPCLEESDKYLPQYPLPEQVEKLLEMGKYENVENRVTKDNYKRRMHNLLYLEEYERRKCMSRYDIYDMEIVTHNKYTGLHSTENYAPQGFHFAKLSLGEMLCEGHVHIRPSVTGKALLLPMNQQVAHECLVEHVGKDSVILKITSKAKQACAASQNRCSFRFIASSRVDMRAMHHAVDNLNLDTIFPMSDGSLVTMDNPSALKKCLDELKTSELNKAQQDAITSMLDPACRQIPSLVLGPFGCGKTRTLKECIKLLCLHFPEARILICTHTNSAADLYVQGMHEEWARLKLGKPPLTRILFSLRRVANPIVAEYCKKVGERWVIPPLAELKRYKMVVATLSTARNLLFTDLPKDHFTHIFIDEAAQALEPESIIPLVMANNKTKIVLAGDHMQLDPPVYSPLARKYNLHLSLLERLYDHEAYDNGVGQLCKTLLTENHRSHELILSLPSKLFYKNKLTCKAVFPSTGPKGIPAIKFVGVEGHEEQDENSPSFYNAHEATEMTKQVQLMVKGGLSPDEICVLSYYSAQIQRIRYHLRQKKLGKVEVQSIENVQGREFRALFLSTVRTCSSEPLPDEDAGFLTNAKLFNTAVTRAKQWLVVVGEPITLCTVGSNRLLWCEFIKNCHQHKSFDYQNAEMFESCLEDKIVVRQLLEKVYKESFEKLKYAKASSSGKGLHLPSTQQSQVAQSSSSGARPNYYQATPQLRMQILRSKVTEAMQTKDETTVAKITEDLSKLSVEQQAYLLSNPKIFTTKVQETEQVLKRAGPTAAIMNAARMQGPLISQTQPPVNPGSGVAALMSDLPPFLQSMMGALMSHMHWCEGTLRTNPVIANTPEMRENMNKQRANLNQQIALVNEQIQLYRDLVKQMKVFQVQAAAASGMAQTQPAGSVGSTNMLRSVGGSMTSAALGGAGGMAVGASSGQFVHHHSQPVFTGGQQPIPPHAHAAQIKQFHHPTTAADQPQQQQQPPTHMMQQQQQQGIPPHAYPAHFQQPRMQVPQQQLQLPPDQRTPASAPAPVPPSNTSFMPQAVSQPPGGPSHFPQAFPSAHPMSQPPQHFPSALPSTSTNQSLLQQQMAGGRMEGAPQSQGRMMSHAARAMGLGVMSSAAPGNSAFTYGVSPYLPNSQEPLHHQQRPSPHQLNQLTVQTGKGSSGLASGVSKNLSPLDAAINESSNRSSPAVARRPMETSELYESDDEFK